MTSPDFPVLARARGITSVCSAHPLVIEAALVEALASGQPALIEATCNQVNHLGGYTGMTPLDFRRFVREIAERVGYNADRILLGGDHLGPNPWKSRPAADAMDEAAAMVRAYVQAGFTKIHLDTSMGCLGEPTALGNDVTAARAAQLAPVAEHAALDAGLAPPRYVVGTEVPVPGGALEEIVGLEVTRPEAALETLRIHREAFSALGLEAAFDRVIAIVVQPGVEFGHANVVRYERSQARELSDALEHVPGLVFEAHSTDYQPAIALREALYGLDAIAELLAPAAGAGDHGLRESMEALLVSEPSQWQHYYHGDARELRLQRHFSYSDRIRYYWNHPLATAAVDRLFARLDGLEIPETLISQYLAPLYPHVLAGTVPATPRALCIAAVRRALEPYTRATQGAA